jgi:hypothetical protein
MEVAMTQPRKPISAEPKVSFAGRALESSELEAISGGAANVPDALEHLANEAINTLAGGLQSAPRKT